MTLHLLQPKAEAHWKRSDPVMHRLSRAHPLDPTPQVGQADGFATLVESITHQQVSMAAARTIHRRLVRTLGGKVTPRRILNRSPGQLCEAGLSRTKAAYLHDLADKTLRGDVEFDRFPAMTDAAILEELTAVKGIGPWTAKMFLLFHLNRPDVFAPEDLGLRMAVAAAYGVPEPKAAKAMERQRAAWAPYNSVAARVLWQSRRAA
jgi:DNA-3-methyladenine glycosylase II